MWMIQSTKHVQCVVMRWNPSYIDFRIATMQPSMRIYTQGIVYGFAYGSKPS